MKYVLDTSVAYKWEVPESDSDKAIRVRDKYRQFGVELIGPDFFPMELAHALTRAERRRVIAIGEARVFWGDVMTTPPVFIPSLPLVTRAIDISSQMRVGVYDCLYVAIAEQEGCELVTADDKLVNNLQKQFPFVRHLSTLP